MIDRNPKQQNGNNPNSLKVLMINISEWYKFLLSKWIYIFLSAFIGVILGFFYSINQPVYYKAEMRFVLDEEKNSVSNLGSIASQFGLDAGGGVSAFSGANLIELMKTRLLIERTLLRPIYVNGEIISIADYYMRLNDVSDSRKHKSTNHKKDLFYSNSDRANFSVEQDSILRIIYKSLSGSDNLNVVQKDKKVSFISIEVKNSNENFAKIFCENLVRETSDFYIQIKSKKAKLNVEILQKQVDSLRSQFNSSLMQVAKENDNIFNLNPALTSKGTIPNRKQLDLQVNSSMLNTLITNLEMSKLALRKETPLIQIIDQSTFPLEVIKINKFISLLIGGASLGFLSTLFLVIRRLFYKLLNETTP